MRVVMGILDDMEFAVCPCRSGRTRVPCRGNDLPGGGYVPATGIRLYCAERDLSVLVGNRRTTSDSEKARSGRVTRVDVASRKRGGLLFGVHNVFP